MPQGSVLQELDALEAKRKPRELPPDRGFAPTREPDAFLRQFDAKPKPPSQPFLPTGQALQESARRVPRGLAASGGSILDAFNIVLSRMVGSRVLKPGRALTAQGVPDDATFAQAMAKVVDTLLPPVTPEAGQSQGLLERTGEGVGSALSFMVPGAALTKAPKLVQTLAVAGNGAAQSLASGYQDALEHGATDDQAWTAGLLNGALGGPTELVGVGGILSAVNKRSGGGLARAIGRTLLTGAEEAGQEIGQEAISDIIAKNLYDEERVVLDGWVRTGQAAGLTGIILQGLVSALPGRGRMPRVDIEGQPIATEPSGAPGQLPADFEPLGASPYFEQPSPGQGSEERRITVASEPGGGPTAQAPGVPGPRAAQGVVAAQAQPQQFASAPAGIAAPAPSQTPPAAPQPAPAQPAPIDVPDENLAGAIKRKLVERFERPRVTQGTIEEATGGPVPEEADVRQAEVLYPGRTQARQEDFNRQYVEPILEKAKEAGVTLEELDRFLMLRHAETRNKVAFQRNPDFDPETNPGIGVPTSQAQAELASMLAGPHGQALQEIGNMVSDVVQFQRDTLEQGRLITPEERQGWERVFGQTYIPAKDIIEDEAPWARSRGFSMRGPESKRVKGRGLGNVSDSPLANLLADTSRAIQRTEKATVDRAMAEQVRQYPQLGWTIDETPPAGHVERADWHERTISYIDAADPIYAPDGSVKSIEHTITFPDPLMARAMRQTSPELGRKIVETVAPIARAYAALNTVWDPTFIARNATRDIELAFARVAAGQGTKAALEVTNPKRLAELGKAIRAVQKDPNAVGSQADMVRRFRAAGGQTAWIEPADPAAKLSKLERTFADFHPTAPRKAWLATRALGKWISEWNNVAENVVRVSAFQWGVENGMSDAQAAKLAKELTINFNAKGEWGPALNVLYLFYNAGVQGPRTIVRMARSKRGKQIIGSLFGLGAIEALVNSMLAGEDPEDGINRYQKVQPWVRSRRMIFWVPGEDYAIAPPMAYGLNVPYEAGRNAMMAALGMLSPGEAAQHTFSSFVSAFSPFGDTGGGASQLVSPWFTDPLVQSVTNKTFYGAPIRPDSPYDAEKPMSQRYWGSMEGSQLQQATTALNNLTGGSNVKSGIVDVSPEDVENFAQFLMGGTGRTVLRAVDLVEDAITGKQPLLKDIPLARDFAVETDERFDRNTFYNVTRDLQRDAKHIEELRATGREAEAERFEKRNAERLRFVEAAEVAADNVRDLNKYTPPFRYDMDAAGDFTFKVKSKGGRYSVKTAEERDALVDKIQREFVRDYMEGQK